MANNKWMDDPVLEGISPKKLKILTEIVENSEGKTAKELMTYFIKSTNAAAKEGIYFNNDETELIVNVLKQGMNEEELKRIDTLRRLANMMSRKKV